MSDIAVNPRLESTWGSRLARTSLFGRRRLFVLVVIAGGVVSSQSQFWNKPSNGDHANWDYFAQVIARGGVPYRDVVNIKSPLSAYMGAAAILVARPFGLSDLLAIRITFVLLTALTAGFTLLVALDYFHGYRVALFAATIMLASGTMARFNGGGVQPKTPMVLFGLVTLWAVMRDRPFAAGVYGMVSALCWQPGLLFLGVAGLAFSRYLTSWRDNKAIKMLVGAVIPLGILLVYFWAAGALRDFYLWCVHFNVTVYAPLEARSPLNFFSQFFRVLHGPYAKSSIYFYTALAGLCIVIWQESRRSINNGGLLKSASRHAVIIAPVIYLGFCMINIQNGPDFIPLIPFVAIFAAVALAFIVEHAVEHPGPGRHRATIENWISFGIVALVLYFGLSGAFLKDPEVSTLNDQRLAIGELASHLEPGDKIFVYGRTEVLVLSGLTNVSKYFVLDRGKDAYLDRVEPGRFEGWLQRLKAERPKVVVLDRLGKSDRLSHLQDWVNADYRMRNNGLVAYYIRKD